MCLKTVLNDGDKAKMLKKTSDPMVCWKTVDEDNKGNLHPIHNFFGRMSYHAGVNLIPSRLQDCGDDRRRTLGAHFFKHRTDAVAKALWTSDRRVIRCLIAKKDIQVVGYTSMGAYNRSPALTVIADRATFAKTIKVP